MGSTPQAFELRLLLGAIDDGGGGLYALTRNGGYVLTRLDENYRPRWASPLLPAVLPPELPPDAPIDELLRASELAHQFASEPVAVGGGVLAAATATRGTLAALNLAHGLELPLPADPRCADVVIARVSADGNATRYFSVPTPDCERLPKLAVVAGHAVVASLVSVDKPPQPNDTSRIEIAVAIVDLETGDAASHRVAFEEDDIVKAIVPCGERACIAGATGARAVDTGSVVAFGDGFIVPIAIDGELGERWTLTSPRHSEVHMLAAGADAVVFFATVNGPITHTADDDPWLGYNEALLGVVPEP